jgi:hypothetical protein
MKFRLQTILLIFSLYKYHLVPATLYYVFLKMICSGDFGQNNKLQKVENLL